MCVWESVCDFVTKETVFIKFVFIVKFFSSSQIIIFGTDKHFTAAAGSGGYDGSGSAIVFPWSHRKFPVFVACDIGEFVAAPSNGAYE